MIGTIAKNEILGKDLIGQDLKPSDETGLDLTGHIHMLEFLYDA